MNAAGRRWARAELRRRWRSVVLLAVLTALAGGVAMAAVTGARRSVVVVDEIMEERRQPDVMSLPNKPGFDWKRITELPYVESYALLGQGVLCVEEADGFEGDVCPQAPVAGGWYDSIWRIDVLEGRMPSAPDEIAVNRVAQARYGWQIGDRLHLAAVGPGRLDEFWEGRDSGRRPWGPRFEVTVTAVFAGHYAWRILSGGGTEGAGVVLSTAFIPAYGDLFEYRVQAFLRLRGGEADIPRLRDDILRIRGDDPTSPLRNVREAQRRVERSTGVEATALALFAVAVLAAAAVLIGQAVTRLVRLGGGDAPTLRALGMAQPVRVVALATPGAVVGVLGAAGAAATAVAVSPRVPIGIGRAFDLHGGVKVDVPVLVVGAFGIAASVALGSVAAALPAVRRLRAPSAPRAGRAVAAIGRMGLPPSAALGVRMALEHRGGAAIPVRPALVGATVGVLAVVAAFTVHDGIADTLAHPERGGRTWDLAYHSELSDEVIEADKEIAGAAQVTRAIVDLDRRPVPANAYRPIGTPLHRVVLDGRLPEADDEIALGPSTARALDVHVGDQLPAGDDGARPVTVVGTALAIEEGGQSAYDEGAWITDAGLARLDPPQIDWSLHLLDVRAGADLAAVRARLDGAGGVVDDARLRQPPAGLDNLRGTRQLPTLLGGFLALLGTGAVGHTLVSTQRRRRRDLAVLRALGMSARQTRAVVAWQATTVAVVGIVVGVPLGLLTGRLVWRWVATSMPLAYVAPAAVIAAVVVVPATLVVVNAVAVWPGRAAARTQPAAVLRAE